MNALNTMNLNALLNNERTSRTVVTRPAARRFDWMLTSVALVAATTLALNAALVLSWVSAGAW